MAAQHMPRQRVVFFPDIQEPAERHDGISDLAGVLVDHDVLDGAEVIAPVVVNVRTANQFGRDQGIHLVARALGLAEPLHVRLLHCRPHPGLRFRVAEKTPHRGDGSLPVRFREDQWNRGAASAFVGANSRG